ncbi:PIN domain-containing protein [Stutzerimonas kunmingensis]|uniref:PIN domain-containing protein n=1 Tax=Stutzerimonas kunmingensis TaxID=1211807 RepID=UPI0028A5DDA7|nr:PIN domain-containing protein [Stutzerimonas kunmingensis]
MEKPRVFLDANIIISAGKPPGGPMMKRVTELVHAEIIDIITTDLTETEVAKKHSSNDYEVIKDISKPHYRKIAKDVGIEIPETAKHQIREKITKKYEISTEKMFKNLKAKKLSIDEVKPSTVFKDYANKEGFFSGEGKKDQFPDAFIFECLRKEAKEAPIVIVSSDGDYVAPVKNEDNIFLLKNLPELFKHLELEFEEPKLDEFLAKNNKELIELVDSELNDWGLIGDVEDSEIDEISVKQLIIEKIVAFKPTTEDDPILVTGSLHVTAEVSYTHPDWDSAAYDSEDKRLIPFDEVCGDTEIDLVIDISMSISVDEDGTPIEIEDFRFRNSHFQYVELHPYDPYEFI